VLTSLLAFPGEMSSVEVQSFTESVSVKLMRTMLWLVVTLALGKQLDGSAEIQPSASKRFFMSVTSSLVGLSLDQHAASKIFPEGSLRMICSVVPVKPLRVVVSKRFVWLSGSLSLNSKT